MSKADAGAVTASYDAVNYEGGCHRLTHPDHLHTLAHLLGLRPADPATARVLEIGCAVGANLLPMASTLPRASLLGIDPSPVQIRRGQQRARELGLANVELRVAGVEGLDAADGVFDYIVCHGVYSWVPPGIRAAVLAACQRLLAPDGVVYLSYNTWPGWHERRSVRDLMLFHTAHLEDPRQRIQQARGVLDMLVDSASGQEPAFVEAARRLREELRDRGDDYLFHEYLSIHNEPMYFTEFVERVRGVGLQYLGDADFPSMMIERFPAEVASKLGDLAHDAVRAEQYMDFLVNRTFRRSLLGHPDRGLNRRLSWKRLRGLRLRGEFQADAGRLDDASAVTFRKQGKRFKVSSPLSKTALGELADVAPASLEFEALVRRVREQLPDRGTSLEQDMQTMGPDLLVCFARGFLELRSAPEPWRSAPVTRPKVSPLVRAEAAAGSRVSSLMHADVQLEALDRALVTLLNGRRDREGLVRALHGALESGRLVLPELQALPPHQREASLNAYVTSALGRFLRLGLLERR